MQKKNYLLNPLFCRSFSSRHIEFNVKKQFISWTKEEMAFQHSKQSKDIYDW